MRRPTPLPADRTPVEDDHANPRTARDEGGETPRGSVAKPSATPSAPPVADGSSPTAPIPLPTDRSGTDGGTSEPSEPAAAPVGLRQIWRAARARRRVLRAEMRRFTARARRRRAIWIGVAGAVLLLVAGTVGAAYSPLLAVERVRVVGVEPPLSDSVERALSAQVGTPLPLVDDSAVKAALVAFPVIESYVLEARPPHELIVRIVERTAVGVVASPAGFTVVDAAGVALSTSQDRPDGFAMLDIDGGIGSDAFAAAGRVLRSLPDDLRSRVSEASASSPEAVSFVLGDTGARVVWGGADESALKVLLLERLMASRPPSAGMTYDVSSTAAVVVR